MNACTLQQARAAKHKAVEMFRGTAAVAGIGITRIENGYGLKVDLERPPESPLPTDVDGVPLLRRNRRLDPQARGDRGSVVRCITWRRFRPWSAGLVGS